MQLPLGSWRKTLAKLGLQPRHARRGLTRHASRPLRMEPLEERQLLTVDLAITDFTSTSSGALLQVSYSVANETSPQFKIGVYSSTDGSTYGPTPLFTHTVSNSGDLTVGSHTVSFSAAYSDPGQDHFLIAQLDSDAAVTETNESNNSLVFGGGVFRANNNAIEVQGGSGADTVTVALSTTVDVTFNGASYNFDPATVGVIWIRTHAGADTASLSAAVNKNIYFWGGPGDDTATVNGSSADETATIQSGTSSLAGPSSTIYVLDASTITMTSGGGNDWAKLYDSAGDDTAECSPTSTTLHDSGYSYSYRADGFKYA